MSLWCSGAEPGLRSPLLKCGEDGVQDGAGLRMVLVRDIGIQCTDSPLSARRGRGRHSRNTSDAERASTGQFPSELLF